MIHGVIGLMLWTDDVDRLAAFYRDVVGLKQRSARQNRVSFGSPDSAFRLNIAKHSEVHGRAQEPKRMMLNLGTDDIHADHARLKERGVPFLRPPEKEGWGGWTATFTDPDGNIVNILQIGGL